MAEGTSTESEVRPPWPEGDSGTVLLDCTVSLPVDEVFLLIYGGENDFRKECEALNKHLNFNFSGWHEKEEDIANGQQKEPQLPPSLAELKKDMMAKKSFEAQSGMGKIYKTQEFLKIEHIEAGKSIVLLCWVITKAPYGDRFRVLLRHRITQVDEKSCRLTISSTIVYVSKINGMIKGMIEKGSKEGMTKTQENMLSLLKTRASVKPFGEQEEQPKRVTRKPVKQTRMEVIFGRRVVRSLAPWASLAQALISQVTGLSEIKYSKILLVGLILSSLYIIRIILAVLSVMKAGSMEPRDPLTYSLNLIFKVFHVPNSLHEVTCSVTIVAMAHWIMNELARILPSPSGNNDNEESSEDVYGIKYEGYSKSMSNVSQQYVGIDQMSEFALGQIAKGMNIMARGLRPRKHKMHQSKPQTITDGPESKQKRKKMGAKEAKEKASKVFKKKGKPTENEQPDDAGEKTESLSVILDPVPYAPPDIGKPMDAIVEEIFENERHQPFRGWGSTWPGHFLPTDKVHRWSVRKIDPSGMSSSQTMSKVVPKLPQDWKWVENAWKLDLSGVLSDSTDNEGWSYGLDFKKTSYPFQPGTGRKKISDFVRTRRWLRTRVPIQKSQESEESTQRDTEIVQNIEGISNAMRTQITESILAASSEAGSSKVLDISTGEQSQTQEKSDQGESHSEAQS
eukprot:jgi/Picsp_1/6032/NSC_03386-R1_protein